MPFAGTDKIDPQISPMVQRQAAGGGGFNPFPGFFIGAGPIGFVGGPDAVPVSGYQSGDTLYAWSTRSSIPGWTVNSSGTLWYAHSRLADGTSSDNIPSTSGVQIIYAFRIGGDGFKFSLQNRYAQNHGTSIPATIPNTASFVAGPFPFSMFMAPALKSGMSNPVNMEFPSPWVTDGSVILGGTNLYAIGHLIQSGDNVNVSQDIPYTVAESTLTSVRNWGKAIQPV